MRMTENAITIDVSTATTRHELHALLARSLEFPTYYGHSRDAFWDCASYLAYSGPISPTIAGPAQLKLRLPEENAVFESCLQRLQRRYTTFRVCLT